MFRIEKLVLNNFGLFYGKQEIVFPKDNGVCIVWGKNAFGKTTITNAFRYVLWDTIYGRKRVVKDPTTYVNTDVQGLGEDMSVELVLNVDGSKYSIIRGLKSLGKGSSNYQPFFSIESDGRIFSPDEAADWLANLLPFEISRFYVFDGELLDEYEDLLDEGSESGEKLKSSIEDILGIPVLINARQNLSTLLSEADQEVQKEAAKSKDTEEWATTLATAREKKSELLASKVALTTQLKAKKDECSDIEEKLRNNSKLSELIAKKDSLNASILKLESIIDENTVKIKETIDSIWETEMSLLVSNLIDVEDKKTSSLQEAKKQSMHFEFVSEFISSQIKNDGSHCPLCKASQSPEFLKEILESFEKRKNGILNEVDEKKLKESQERIDILSSIPVSSGDFSYVGKLIDEVREQEAELAVSRTTLSDYISQIKDYSNGSSDMQDEIASLPEKYRRAIKSIEEINKGLDENKKNLELADKTITKSNEMISKLSGNKKTSNASAKREFIEMLYHTIDDSIASFRNRIQTNVETAATESFIKISHQGEFKSLKINDSFGLQIIKEDGSVVPNRSSGYEQVVAISLISALHKNAPIAGPVFLDSTFQRVDIEHKINTLKNLSSISDQVIILAYPQEIGDENEVRKVLQSQLKKEITIKQISSSKSYFE